MGWGWGSQYLLKLGVGGVTHKLQNEALTGGEEGAALPHPGQCHQPVHLAARGTEVVGAAAWMPRHPARSTGIPLLLDAPSVPHVHPPRSRTLSPAGGTGIHHHVDLQSPLQEVQGGVLGAEKCQDQPQARTGAWGGGLGSRDVDEEASDQGRGPPSYNRV